MITKRITATRAVKINLGNYENTDITTTVELEAAEGEDWKEVANHAHQMAIAVQRGQAEELFKDLGTNTKQLKRLGLG